MNRFKIFRFPLLLVSTILFFSDWVWSQDSLTIPKTVEERYEAFVKYLSPEKVYLHTDKDVYAIGDTIWFKCYVANRSLQSDYPESRFVYVELVGTTVGKDVSTNRPTEISYVIQRVKVKMWNGVLEGYVHVPDDVNTGYATLRAFTYWMLNKDAEYVFKKEISIINPLKDSFVEELKEKKMRDDSHYEDIGMENPFHPIKRVETMDCAFLPESGRLLKGVNCRIGVKIINEQGLGQQAEGKVFDHNDVQVASFTTDEYGFGSFCLSPIAEKEKYYAKIEDIRGVSAKVKLPDVENEGGSIAIKPGKDMIHATVSISGISADDLKFVLCSGDEIYYQIPVTGSVSINLPVTGMAPGINNAVLCTSNGKVIAKRPFFIFPKNSVNAEMDTLGRDYGKRENVSLKLDMGGRSGGDFSVSVTDDFLAPHNRLNNNIISYMFLSSEIRGNLENPQRFFNDSVDIARRMEDVDLMLMTQGWEYYDLPAVLAGQFPMPKFGREYIQSIAGQVNKGFLKKKKSTYVAFIAPKINFAALGKVDPEGYFELKDIDFPDSTTFIVNASKRFDGRGHLKPIVYEDSYAPFTKFVHNREKVLYSPKVAEIVTKNYYNAGGDLSYQLNSITVYGRKKSLKGISPFPMMEFRQDQIREGRKLEAYNNFDMVSYIVTTVPGTREGFTRNGRTVLCRVPATATGMTVGDGWASIIVFIDGMHCPEAWELEQLMVDDVETVVYLKGMDASPFALYSPLFGYGNNTVPDVVLVKTKPIHRTLWHITYGRPLGWQKPKHFYAPKYEVEGKDIVPKGQDRRSTLYWNPSIKADENGEINFRFNTSDLLSGYTVILEGVTSDGEYVSRQFNLK
ncbi:MAG: hypothetical protein IKS82_05810 [Bacteroidales bacterium]|nr:hypothetical protein [Bacteroidales bacterium]